MEMKTNIPANHIGIFHDKHRFSGGKRFWCFYATISGQCPIKKEGAWYNYIDNCKELLAVKNTRATLLLLETMTTTTASTNLIDQTLPQQPAKKKRKVSELQTSETQQQPQANTMSPNGADNIGADVSSSSVDHRSLAVQPHPSYWDSNVTKKCFYLKMVRSHAKQLAIS